MQVHRVELFHVAVPCEETFHPAWLPAYPQTDNRYTLLRLSTRDGHTGYAAGPAMGREREGLGDLIGPYLVELEADDLETVRHRIREASYLGWRNPWVEAAFLDLWGRLESKPVCELLGGDPRELDAYLSTGVQTTRENAADQVAMAAELGVEVVKLRAHADTLDEDVEMLEAGAEAADEHGVRVAVDANQGWFVDATGPAERWDLDRATAFGEACDRLDVAWLEEPLDMHDVEGMAKLREAVETPIAGGELLGDLHAFRPLFEHGCLDKYQPDAVMCGGAETSLAVAERCRDEGLSFAPHTWTNGIGLLYNAHILAASGFEGPLEWPHDPPGWTPEVRDGVLARTLELEDGRFEVPDRPGLGVELDEDALDRYGEKFYEATPGSVAWDLAKDKGLVETIKYAFRR